MNHARLLAVLCFLPLTSSALAAECVPQPDGSCQVVVTEEVIDLEVPLVDIDPNPFPEIFDVYESGDPDVFVSGPLPESTRLALNWSHHPRPAFDQLTLRVEATLAQQLGVPVDGALRRSAHGQITSLTFVRLMEIINTPAADRDSFEQQVYAEVRDAFSTRRRHIATLAAEQYNLWRNDPCNFQVPVGDDPNAYLSQTGVSSYCLGQEFGNPLVVAFTTTPAIPSSSYLYWATLMRAESFKTYWAASANSLCADGQCPAGLTNSEISADVFAKSYTDTQQAMAYHLAWGTLASLPGFDFDEIYSDDPSFASDLQGAVADFAGAYFRDFLGTMLLQTIATGAAGLVPDPHDIIILATAMAVHSVLEIVSQVESQEGIDEALALSAQSLEAATSSDAGRAELLVMLIELGMPDLLKFIELPDHETPVAGVFYSTQSPQSDRVHLEDWGTDYFLNEAPNAQYLFSDQQWLSRSLGGAIDVANPRYDGFTSHVRHVTPDGDFATAWLIKGRNGAYREFLITPYARLIRDVRASTDTEARVRVQRRFNNDCPAQSSYPFGSSPTDHGMSCVIVDNGVWISRDLVPGDSVIIAGRVATVHQVNVSDTVPSYVTGFSTVEPIVEGDGMLVWQRVHKIAPAGGSGVPTDRFEYQTFDGSATAILDFGPLPPEIHIADPSVVAEANAVLSTVDLGTVTATDPTEGAVEVTSDAPETFPLGPTTVTYVASDSGGNTSTATQTVTVVDTTPPQFPALPPAMSVEASADPMPLTLDPPEATDIFPVTLTSDMPAGGLLLGDTVISWTATDANGNSATAPQTVTVTDTTPPEFTSLPADLTVEATGPMTPVDPGVATATDIFGATVTHDVPTGGFAVGTHSVTWTAVDGNGNQTQATQTVTVADTTPPEIAIERPAIQIEASAVLSPVELGTTTALDLVDGVVPLNHDAPAAFPLGTTVVTYTAADSRGNLATATQTVTVVDTTPPEFTTLPTDIDRIADGQHSSLDLGTVEASDIFAVTIGNDAPAVLPVGTTVITWTATDASGNTATTTQTVRLSYRFGGFAPPVVANGAYKVNRVLPLRISLTYADGTVAEGAEALLAVGIVGNDDTTSVPVVIDAPDSADSGNRFQLRGTSYQYNLDSRNLAPGVYRLMVTLDDGNHYAIDITLR
jgi:hypothetical protein